VYDVGVTGADGLLETFDELVRGGDLKDAVARLGESLHGCEDPEALLLHGRLAHLVCEFETARVQLDAALAGFLAVGTRRRAAVAASWLARVHLDGWGNRVVGSAWLRRAAGLLDGEEPCLEEGIVAVAVLGCGVADAGALEANARLALDRARRFGDLHLEARALAESGLALVSIGHVDEGMARLDEAMTMALGPGLGDPVAVCEAGCCMLSACARTGDLDRMEAWLQFAQAQGFYHPGNPLFFAACTTRCGALLCEAGRWQEAEGMLVAGVEAGDRSGQFFARLEAYVALADLRIHQGRLEEAERLLLGLDDRAEALAPLARLHIARGDHDLALAVARRGLRLFGADRLRAVPLLLRAVEAELGLGDLSAAAATATELSELAAHTRHSASIAQAALAGAKVAAARCRPAEAVESLEDALAGLGERLPLLRAEIHFALAGLLADARAVADARAAIALHTRVGAPIGAEATRLLRDLGLAPGAAVTATLERDGRFWTVRYGDAVVRLRDSKGIGYLAELLANPGEERHVFDLVDLVEGVPAEPGMDRRRLGDAGPHLDAQAKNAYRHRLEELRTAMDDADACGDQQRAERLQAEMDALVAELGRAMGLGGRDRRASSAAEKARLNVTRALRAAIDRIREAHADLGAHLDEHVRTGMFCAYRPGAEVAWTVSAALTGRP
jgi:tetratricopeptide (TPR) repeat protein